MKAVIFDLDGVLVFTDKFHYQAWKKTADSLGIYFDETVNNSLRGIGRMESLDIILERYEGEALTKERKSMLAAEKNESYKELLNGMTPKDVQEEVRETLAELRRRGYATAVASSSKNARFILERTALLDMFDAISDGNDIEKPKPDPEVFLTAAEFLCVRPGECLVVEDAEAGIRAAHAGGFKSAGLSEAGRYILTDYPLDSIKDLLKICSWR